jgi:cysteine synthase B
MNAPISSLTSLTSLSSLTTLIGDTPLLELRRIASHVNASDSDVRVFAKAEWFNPSGSVKDRAAWNIVQNAIRSGQLTRDKTLLDATSGNMGIAYAMLGAALGYKVKLVMPRNVTRERKIILGAYGAEIEFSSAMDGSDGAIELVREIYARDSGKYYYADQYNNEANWRAHYQTTAEEIWRQTNGQVTHFVAGLGTSGTFVGTARRLRELNPNIQCISLQPDGPLNAIEGWKHMPTAIVPGIYDVELASANVEIVSEAAHDMSQRLAREEGLFVSPSAGAAAVGALQVAAGLRSGVVVTLFADAGYKYLSEKFRDGEGI